jgi:hypothetical protein
VAARRTKPHGFFRLSSRGVARKRHEALYVAHALACCGGIYAAIFPDVEMDLAAAR